jgi:hypothetical protein
MRSNPKHLIATLLLVAGVGAFAARAQTFSSQDVGSPALAGTTTVVGDVITIKGGGNDIWNNSDNFHYYYTAITGNFDVRVRVQSLEGPDAWTKAELMARQDDGTGVPKGGDQHISMMTTRTAGQNQVGIQWRQNRDGGSQWPPDIGGTMPTVAPSYPNTWLRLVRIGSVFTGYSSTDGIQWLENYSINTGADAGWTAWPNKINIGLAVTAHNDTDTTGGIAVFSDLTFSTDPLLVATGHGAGFEIGIGDSSTVVIQTVTAVVLDGGEDVRAKSTVSKAGGMTSIRYNLWQDKATLFESGSVHTVSVSVTAQGGGTYTLEGAFTVQAYVNVPPSYALATPATAPGLIVNKVFQTAAARGPGDGNFVYNAEMHLAGGMVNSDGTPQANIAEFAGPFNIGGEFSSDLTWSRYVNWEQASGLISTTDPQPDNFNSNEPPGSQGQIDGEYMNNFIPGVQLGTVSPPDPDNFVLETIAYARLAKGLHRWGVNSDDGFKVSVAPGQPSPFGLTLGQFSGGRGATDTTFDFYVDVAGDYPVRLLYWEGNGGANCEWFSQNIDTGEKILIGDTLYYPTAAAQVFRTGQGRATITKLKPSNGYQGTQAVGPVEVQITDGRTQASNALLFLDGAQVATGTKAGAVTTLTYTPASEWALGSQHTGQIVYTESGQTDPITNNFSFAVRSFTLADMPAGTFWIEAEDWNHSSGQTVSSASTMPYLGGAYSGLLGVLNVDYFDDNNNPDTDAGIDYSYRGSQRPNHANITVHQGANVLAIERPNGVTMTTNYRLGWAGNFWGNYTRTIPAGVYKGAAALSTGNGTGYVMYADLDRVTGADTTSQTLDRIGTFTGAGSGGWGSSILVPLKTPLGADAVFKLPGGPVTLRVTARDGDFDWFALIPVTEAIAPIVKSITPNLAHTVFRDASFSIEIEEFTTQLDEDSIEMTFDGAPVTPTFNRVGDRVTISFDPPGLLDIGRPYEFSLTYSDDATPANSESISSTLVAHYLPNSPAGMFLIEAEDFNTDGGSVIPAVNTMPYLGNAYTNLSAVAGTDYIRVGDEPLDGGVLAGNNYRIGESPNVPMGANQGAVDDPVQVFDLVRAMDANRNVTWQMDVNFSLGWAGTGHWFNYTRNIPSGTYQIFAAMSYDGAGVDQLNATLDRVTGSASVPDAQQVKVPLGRFHAPGTGGWGSSLLVPLRNTASDALQTVELGGNTTLRFNWASGDFDYMMLVPTSLAPPGLEIDSIALTTGGKIKIQWTGTATLQSTPQLPATQWTDVTGESGVELDPPASGNIFFRLQQ